MSERYERNLTALRREIDIGGARPSLIDIAVSNLLQESSENIVSDLLLMLSDTVENDAGMFSLIHAAETYDDKRYVRALISAFPRFVSSAPRWASIVFVRVLNNKSSQIELTKQLSNASSFEKEIIRNMCKIVEKNSPNLLDKTALVKLAAS